MDQSARRNDNMGTDPLGDMFSRMFDQMQPQEPTNMTSTTDTDVARLEEEKRELNRQISELRSKNSTLSSGNQELQSTNQQLLSTNRTLRKRLSELNETTKLLGEIKKRERACAKEEERCNHILNRQAALESREAKLQSDRARFDSEREQLYKSIAEQVSQEVERERQRLGEDNDRRCEKAKRILFALCVGVCSFAVPMLAIVMAGRWHILAATLPEWLHARKQQFAAIGQWLGNVGAWLSEIIPQGWWNGPLTFLLTLLILVAVCAVPLLIVVGYMSLTKMAVMDWWREKTFGVHAVLWTLLILASLAVADRLATIPNSPMHWLTWWMLLVAVVHPIYLLKVASKISRFIKKG